MARLQELCPDLTHGWRAPGGWRWFARSPEDAAGLAAVGRCTAERPELGCRVTLLDEKRHRELAIVERDGKRYFEKRFLLRDAGEVLRETLRLTGHLLGFKGAALEARHTLLAEKRLRRVARLHALGERVVAGLVVEQVLLFDALVEHVTLVRALEDAGGDRERLRELLERAFAIVVELLDAGLVHLDLNAKNVMVSPSTPDDDCAVDMEQLVEVDRGRDDVVAFALGYLYHWRVRELVPREDYDELALRWMPRALGGAPPSLRLLRAYRFFQKNALGRRARLRMVRVGLERMRTIRARVQRQDVSGLDV